jgi:hypothetical protein
MAGIIKILAFYKKKKNQHILHSISAHEDHYLESVTPDLYFSKFRIPKQIVDNPVYPTTCSLIFPLAFKQAFYPASTFFQAMRVQIINLVDFDNHIPFS